MKDPQDRREHEIKVRFSQRELELAAEAEKKYGICRAEMLRDLYMNRIYSLISFNSKSNVA